MHEDHEKDDDGNQDDTKNRIYSCKAGLRGGKEEEEEEEEEEGSISHCCSSDSNCCCYCWYCDTLEDDDGVDVKIDRTQDVDDPSTVVMMKVVVLYYYYCY